MNYFVVLIQIIIYLSLHLMQNRILPMIAINDGSVCKLARRYNNYYILLKHVQ